MSATLLRPRGVGEILDTGFQLYRRRWAAMASATLIILVPVLVLEAVAPLNWLPILERISNLFFMAASAAVVVIASGAYLGHEVTAGEAIGQMRRRFLSVWGAAIFQSIIVSLGLLLLIVPGIFALAYTFAMQQAVMVEGRSTDEAWERSKELARGHVRPILFTSVMAFVFSFFVGVGTSAVLMQVVPDIRMQTVLFNLVLVAVNPIVASIGTVLYYDLRIRKEAFDVSVATDRLEAEPVLAV